MDSDDYKFFRLRSEGKTYITKVFEANKYNPIRMRNVRMVLEGSDEILFGEIEGAMCLRLSGSKRKTQVTALVSQDDKEVRRLSLQTFKPRAGGFVESIEKDEFTFRRDEFERLLAFLKQIEFVDFSNQNNFQIRDISREAGPKAIIDASEMGIVERLRNLNESERDEALSALGGALTTEEINVLLGRKAALEVFNEQMLLSGWKESEWQEFFDREQWVFGYGLDYRVMRQFDREMTVGSGGTDGKNRPITDFLMTFTDYTVLVEIKTPQTEIFKSSRRGRAGTWEFSTEFTAAISQALEQKAEWLSFAQTGEHYDKVGNERLAARTRDAKTILVIGSKTEFRKKGGERDQQIMADTFELFRRDTRNIDIVTFDELLERASFIAQR